MEQIPETNANNTIINNKENAASLNQPAINETSTVAAVKDTLIESGKLVVTSPSETDSPVSMVEEIPSDKNHLAPPPQEISEPAAMPPPSPVQEEETKMMDIEKEAAAVITTEEKSDQKQEEDADKRTPRSSRVKKSVERYDGGQAATPKTPTATVEGSGKRLGEFEGITHEISKKLASDEILILLHRILYGRNGEASKRKAEIRNFRGFGASVEQSNIVTRMSKPTVAELRSICHVLNLKESGEKSAIVERISEFLTEPKTELLKPTTTSSSSAKKTPTRKRAASTTPSKGSKKTPTPSASSKKKGKAAELETEVQQAEGEGEDVSLKTPSKKAKVATSEMPVEEPAVVEEKMEEEKDVLPEKVDEPLKEVEPEPAVAETETMKVDTAEEPIVPVVSSEPITADLKMEEAPKEVVAEIFAGSSPSNEEITSFISTLLKSGDLNEITKGKVRTSIMGKFGISEPVMTEKKAEINGLIDQVINTLQ